MKLKNISYYRQEIMGFAILLIMIFHSKINLAFYFLKPLGTVKELGYFGVDIFFLLSGFSLAVGWSKKNYTLLQFYQKRLARIIPGFLVIAVLTVCSLIISRGSDFSLAEALSKIGIGFVFARNYDWWFVPAIIFCYMIFPYLIKLVNNILFEQTSNLYVYLSFLVLFIPGMICLLLVLLQKNVILILLTRIPNFIIGICLGVMFAKSYYSKISKDQANLLIALMTGLGIALLIVVTAWMSQDFAFSYGFLWYPFVFLTLPIVLLLGNIFQTIKKQNNKLSRFTLNLFSFCGGLSYELFLSHGFLFNYSDVSYQFFSSTPLLVLLNLGRCLEYLLLISLSFWLALLLNRGNHVFSNTWKSKFS